MNWYLNGNVKTALNYERTSFDGGAAAGGRRPRERFHLEPHPGGVLKGLETTTMTHLQIIALAALLAIGTTPVYSAPARLSGHVERPR